MTTHAPATARPGALAPYFVLAFGITWALVLPLVLGALGRPGWQVSPHWHALGGFGPGLAALIVSRWEGGRRGQRALLASLGRWRVGRGWLLVSALSPFALFALAVGLVAAFGGGVPDFSRWPASLYAGEWGVTMLVLTSLTYGFGEELGWRGFALPRLQARYSALAASALLTVPWALWHLPFFLYRFDFGLVQAVGFFVGLLAGAIWLTSLSNATGGSVLTVALWHTAWNIVNQTALVVSSPVLSLLSAFVMVAAVLTVWRWGPATLAPGGRRTARPLAGGEAG